MNQPEVSIEHGLPESLRHRAAEVFDEAFGGKLSLAIPSREKRLAVIRTGMVAEHALVALVDGELAGIAGLHSHDGAWAGGIMTHQSLSFGTLVAHLGYLGAVRAAFVLMLGRHEPEPGELYIDGIAVAAAARGRGIGTRLLDEVASIAREDGFDCVRLEVVDTNPRAQALYEREGYRVTKVERFGFMRRIIGFGGVAAMELRIERTEMASE